jgi:Ca-activated chloride channel family protein
MIRGTHRKRIVSVIAVLLSAPAIARAENAGTRAAAENVRDGNKLLDAGRFDEALTKYDEAMKVAPETPEIAYNRGIALYRLGKYVEAEKAFQDALEPGRLDLEAKTKYNLGRAAHAAAIEKKDNLPDAINDLGRAISFYNDALQIAKQDPDGVMNKEAAERLRAYLEKRLEQQQEQKKEQSPSSQPNDEPTSQPDEQPPTSQPTSQPSSQPSEQQQQKGDEKQDEQGDENQQSQDEKDGDKQDDQEQQDQQNGSKDDKKQGEQKGDQKSADQQKGDQKDSDNKMSEEEAEPMLQEARDAERDRREARRAKMMRMRGRIPVDKDW